MLLLTKYKTLLGMTHAVVHASNHTHSVLSSRAACINRAHPSTTSTCRHAPHIPCSITGPSPGYYTLHRATLQL